MANGLGPNLSINQPVIGPNSPFSALAKANNKFSKRWRRLERFIIKDKKEFNDLNLKDFDFYWHKAKNN